MQARSPRLAVAVPGQTWPGLRKALLARRAPILAMCGTPLHTQYPEYIARCYLLPVPLSNPIFGTDATDRGVALSESCCGAAGPSGGMLRDGRLVACMPASGAHPCRLGDTLHEHSYSHAAADLAVHAIKRLSKCRTCGHSVATPYLLHVSKARLRGCVPQSNPPSTDPASSVELVQLVHLVVARKTA